MIIRATDAPIFTVPGFSIRGLASPARGSKELSSWRLEAAPGASSPAHTLSNEEIFHVLRGALRLTLDDVDTILHAGDAAAVHAGTRLRVSNPFDADAEAVVCVPAGIQAHLLDGTALGTPEWAR